MNFRQSLETLASASNKTRHRQSGVEPLRSHFIRLCCCHANFRVWRVSITCTVVAMLGSIVQGWIYLINGIIQGTDTTQTGKEIATAANTIQKIAV